MRYKYPCTRHIPMDGFGSFLERESTSTRHNLTLFSNELKQLLCADFLTLVNSGSSANLVAALLLAEKVRASGKEMTAAISAFTFPTTVSALLLAGFQVKVVDTGEDSFNISVDVLEEMNPLPSVIAVTHFLGFPCEIEKIADLAHRNGSFILQDACETLCMKRMGLPVHAYGDVTSLSFYHPHHLSSYGGGAVVTNSLEDYLIADSITHWGRSCKCHIDEHLCSVPKGPAHNFTYERIGLNVEMSELNACFGRWQLLQWYAMENIRTKHYNYLYTKLKDLPNIQVWPISDTGCSPFVFPVRLKNGMTVENAYDVMTGKGVEIRTLMGGVVTGQKAFQKLQEQQELKNAKEMAKTTFFVGIHQTLSEEDIKFIAKSLEEL